LTEPATIVGTDRTAPQPGAIVQVRSRRYLVESVEPPIDTNWEQTLVDLSCLDDDSQGERLSVLWEREVDATILQASLWNNVASRGFDPPDKFAAYLNAIRWNLVTSTNPKLFQAPHRAGIQVMTYQLEPLRKALLLPRVNLFIADDVGLGKTIEAGLILREMIMRQKVKRIVIACPASVITQWQTEMEVRFGLTFVILDREYVIRCRRERGYGINPWKTHSRFIVSHSLLRDEQYGEPLRDWLQENRSGSMLVLDEAHHAAPATSSRYAVDSQFTRAMRELTGLFEHRLFLSATPHNGHSNSFSALLAMLDPQRFFRGERVTNPQLLDKVMVRRLKDELRELVPNLGLPKRVVKQHDISGLPEDAPELKLMRLLNEYGQLREQRLTKATRGQQAAASLVICTLQKRLLSSLEAFASTLRVHRKGLDDQTPEHFDGQEQLDLDAPGADDERGEQPEEQVTEELDIAVSRASKRSRGTEPPSPQELEILEEMAASADRGRGLPDGRMKDLAAWIRANLLDSAGRWNHRRVLIFTEYTETKRYLEQQLQGEFAHTDQIAERIATFHGGMGRQRLDAIKLAFNASPEKHPLRILIATDAAREGVNLQNYCADLFHFDVPWNPSRMEQRNGRIDRKLQREKEVRCHYFVYTQRPEDDVIRTLVRKTDTIQRELGSLSPVLEKRIEDLLAGGLRAELAGEIEKLAAESEERKRVEEEQESVRKRGKDLSTELDDLSDLLEDSKRFVGLNLAHFRNALSLSLELNRATGLESVPGHHPPRWKLPEMPAAWAHTLDSLRSPRKKDQKLWEWREENPILPVVFESPEHIDDTCVHLHLEHRVVQRLLDRFRAQGFVWDDLARACVGQTDDAIRRVILIGRLSLYGPGASRLHDELVMVTSRWVDPISRKEPLKPYAEDVEKYTIQKLEESFAQVRDRKVQSEVEEKLKVHAPQDVAELLPYLKKRADSATAKAADLLAKRGEKEAKELRTIIEDQRKRIMKLQGEDSAQMTLGFDERELRQREAERKAWNKRLSDIESEVDAEPAKIIQNYKVQTSRVEPIGVVYLWPVSG
jgi:SNF2 family DNA or RNA helicase